MAKKKKKKGYPSMTREGDERVHGSYLGKKQYQKQIEEVFEYEGGEAKMTKRQAEEIRRKKKKKRNY